MKKIPLLKPLLVTLSLLFANQLQGSVSTDLVSLVSQGQTLRQELASVEFIPGQSSCTQLGTLNTSLEDYISSMQLVYLQLTEPISITEQVLTSLDEMTSIALDMSQQTVSLSFDLRNMEDVAELFQYRSALSAMLRLSDDIGTMANRILEMADRILLMSDNIGLMADRILITQQLQRTNIVQIQNTMLTTQQNIIALSDSLSSIGYNLTLGLLIGDADQLMEDMGLVTLTEANMAQELARIESLNTALLSNTVDLITWVTRESEKASHYINGDTLTLLGDLSNIHKALALSLESYANQINQLAPLTSTPILSDATASVLRLTRDIGIMSDRIMEMMDRIMVMADNMGLMADRIVETQELQLVMLEDTKNALLTSQSLVIQAIANQNL